MQKWRLLNSHLFQFDLPNGKVSHRYRVPTTRLQPSPFQGLQRPMPTTPGPWPPSAFAESGPSWESPPNSRQPDDRDRSPKVQTNRRTGNVVQDPRLIVEHVIVKRKFSCGFCSLHTELEAVYQVESNMRSRRAKKTHFHENTLEQSC